MSKQGGGTLTLSGASSYNNGTSIIGGGIRLGIDNALPTATALTRYGSHHQSHSIRAHIYCDWERAKIN